DRDHFLQNAKTSVASLRRLITPSRNADHDQPGILITFIGIRIRRLGDFAVLPRTNHAGFLATFSLPSPGESLSLRARGAIDSSQFTSKLFL
ncbi:MAG: hypothetical protein WCE53_15935, partial [Candidatus Acidiferrum sp.]